MKVSLLLSLLFSISLFAEKPNIVLVMADDQGWGQTSYNNHPILKTPNMDAMAANGLRFNRFYAGAPVCSPTRASVLTGRCSDRTGVFSHGYPLCLQEKTLPQALQKAGYATAHFGKWHLNGIRGHGVPVLANDTHHPGKFGFDEWLTVTNFFDIDPLMGRKGKFESFKGDSSEIIVDEALKFIKIQTDAKKPFLAVVWYGSPHSPFVASEEDRKPFSKLPVKGQHHHGEIVAMDRSLGTLRKGLRDLGIAENTILWYCSDNGGLKVGVDSVGGLRGLKGSMYEGGLRVPGIIEWPGKIKPRITDFPASVMDIMPTIIDLLELPKNSMLPLHDGDSLKPLLSSELSTRKKPIVFHYSKKQAAIIDNDYKIISQKGKYELFNLKTDQKEQNNLITSKPEVAKKMKLEVDSFMKSVAASYVGADYPEGKITAFVPPRIFWTESEAYKPYFSEIFKRPEYKIWEKKALGAKKKKKKKKK